MSSKQSSTISAKPAIDPALQWIGGSASEQPASQQANLHTSQQVDSTENQATAMLSARVPVELIRKLRIRAATEGRPIQEILTELLRDYLEVPADE